MSKTFYSHGEKLARYADIPTNVSQLINDADYANKNYVDESFNELDNMFSTILFEGSTEEWESLTEEERQAYYIVVLNDGPIYENYIPDTNHGINYSNGEIITNTPNHIKFYVPKQVIVNENLNNIAEMFDEGNAVICRINERYDDSIGYRKIVVGISLMGIGYVTSVDFYYNKDNGEYERYYIEDDDYMELININEQDDYFEVDLEYIEDLAGQSFANVPQDGFENIFIKREVTNE